MFVSKWSIFALVRPTLTPLVLMDWYSHMSHDDKAITRTRYKQSHPGIQMEEVSY